MSFMFTEEEVGKATVYNRDPDCNACGLCTNCNSPKMDVHGKGLRNAMLLGEGPGPTEDSMNDQWVGRTGTYLGTELSKVGLNIDKDFYKFNVVNCWPHNDLGGTITPKGSQIKACKPYVDTKIEEYNPKFIVAVGNSALESMLGDRFTNTSITRWRGLCIPDKIGWIIPIFHPSYVSRMGDESLDAVFRRDIKNIKAFLTKRPFIPLKEEIEIVYNIRDILDIINGLHGQDIYFDYETTGLKPYRPNHRIVTIAVGNKDIAYSFPYMYKDHFTQSEIDQITKAWTKLMLSSGKKSAQNIKFEDTWTREIVGCRPVNWEWCTMLASHVLDNRRAFTGLKFQTYINFGVDPYDKDIQQYLKSEKKEGGNAFNTIDEAPLDKLLEYGGRDVFYGANLMNKQEIRLQGRLKGAFEFLVDGVLAMSDVQRNGVCVNEKYYHDEEIRITDEIKDLTDLLMNSEPAKRFEKATGRAINLKSNPDMGHLFFDVLKMEPGKLTDKGNPSVDKESIELLYDKIPKRYEITRKPFIHSLFRVRQLDKIVGTYLGQFGREAYGGMIHPFFDLHIPISYRGSSSNPNFQNIPKRDEESKEVCRSGIMPSPGFQLMEADYSGIEVGISACYNLDPNMIKYVSDKTTDMHRDTAMDIWKIKKDQMTDDIRFYTKNSWVFAQFYGSYYTECAKALWQTATDLTTPDGTKLQSIFNSYDDFCDHLYHVERMFWDDRFPVYKQWKKDIVSFYQKHGYIDTYLGFKFRGFMKRNDATNYPIQGTAFHCLLWSLVRLNRLAKKEGWKTKIIGQIHDSIVFDLWPSERDHVIKSLMDIGTKKIRERFDWIIVPLEIDVEIAPVDRSWYELEKI